MSPPSWANRKRRIGAGLPLGSIGGTAGDDSARMARLLELRRPQAGSENPFSVEDNEWNREQNGNDRPGGSREKPAGHIEEIVERARKQQGAFDQERRQEPNKDETERLEQPSCKRPAGTLRCNELRSGAHERFGVEVPAAVPEQRLQILVESSGERRAGEECMSR